MSSEVFAFLPDVVWFLTQNGRDMWCRVPYGFFFTSHDAATAFAPKLGTAFDLAPLGMPSKALISEEGLAALRNLNVTRIFVDPEIDPVTGDVHGRILRIEGGRN